MGDRLATIDMGEKRGDAVPLSVGELGPHLTQCRLMGRGLYRRIKWHLHLSSRLVTTDVGRKLQVCPFWGELAPHLTQCDLGRPVEAYLRAKFQPDPSSRLATIHQRYRQTDRTRQKMVR